MLKASAGGGGRGMRLVDDPADLEDAFEAASAEAGAAFGDGTLYVEKVLQPARHVEIQVLCDAHGNVLTLGERECSIQRRHQKLIEETPSPALTPELREEMEAAAERACRAVGYRNAGTFEFLLGPDGLVLVHRAERPPPGRAPDHRGLHRASTSSARSSRSRPASRCGVTGRAPRRGHAIEIRLNAEDPAHDFRAGAGDGDEVPAAARARGPRRHVRRGRLGDPAVLRLADREARRVGHRPARRDRAGRSARSRSWSSRASRRRASSRSSILGARSSRAASTRPRPSPSSGWSRHDARRLRPSRHGDRSGRRARRDRGPRRRERRRDPRAAPPRRGRRARGSSGWPSPRPAASRSSSSPGARRRPLRMR